MSGLRTSRSPRLADARARIRVVSIEAIVAGAMPEAWPATEGPATETTARDARVTALAVFAVTTTDEVHVLLGALDRSRVAGIHKQTPVAAPRTPTPRPPEPGSIAVQTLLGTAGTLHGPATPALELAVGRATRGALGRALRGIGRVLLAGGRRREALFELGAILGELRCEFVTVRLDAIAKERARIRFGRTASCHGLAFCHVVRVLLSQLSERLGRGCQRAGLVWRRLRRRTWRGCIARGQHQRRQR
jgi:coenzyme F420-reducing hydrogenase delta subunit